MGGTDREACAGRGTSTTPRSSTSTAGTCGRTPFGHSTESVHAHQFGFLPARPAYGLSARSGAAGAHPHRRAALAGQRLDGGRALYDPQPGRSRYVFELGWQDDGSQGYGSQGYGSGGFRGARGD